MTLCYDFDIFEITPKKSAGDKELQAFLNDAGLASSGEGGAVALFRDERTANSLRNAPDALRDYFLNSGFGLNTYDSGAPVGCYPLQDEEARLVIIERLTENASHHILPSEGATAGEFRLSDFLAQLSKATPVEMGDLPEAVDAITPVIHKDARRIDQPHQGVLASLGKRFFHGMPLLKQFRRAPPENA